VVESLYSGKVILQRRYHRKMKAIIDRFEGNYAVCESEDGKMFNLSRSKLPSAASEGDVIIIEGDNVFIDVKATEERNRYIKELMDDVWE